MTQSLEQRLKQLEDYQEIGLIKARYCEFLDRRPPAATERAPDSDGIAVLFAEDGILDNRPGGPYAVGREAIRTMYWGRRTNVLASCHNVMNPIIQIDGDTALGQWHAIFYSRTESSGQSHKQEEIGFGTYHDEFVRTPEGWRFKKVRLIFTSDRPNAQRIPTRT